jgi:hypothetical protein
MIRKLAYIIISAAILFSGYLAFQKLGYWNRSISIFNYKSGQSFGGRGGRGFEGRGEFMQREGFQRPEGGRGVEGRPDLRNIPDSVRRRFEAGRQFQGDRVRNLPDSLRRNFPANGRRGEELQEGRMRGGEGRGRNDFRGGKKISLYNVRWFLAVFASFTVVALFIDKICIWIYRKVFKRVL